MDEQDRLMRAKAFLAQNDITLTSASLRQSGEYSDVTVICGGREWRLHKAIICPRCRFFQKAFSGGFEGAETSTISLDGIDPKHFKQIAEYIYTGDFDLNIIPTWHQNIYVACSEFSLAVDYLGMDALLLDIISYMKKSSRPLAESLRSDIQKGFPSKTFIYDFIKGAKLAFGNETATLDPLRHAYVQFVADAQYIVLRDKTFHDALSQVPEFAAAILQSTFAGGSPFYKLENNNRLPFTGEKSENSQRVSRAVRNARAMSNIEWRRNI